MIRRVRVVGAWTGSWLVAGGVVAGVWSGSAAEAVVGGTAAVDGQHPWTVSVQRDGRHVCGGAIYNGHSVLTSARCVQGGGPGVFRVRYGSLGHSSGGASTGVAKVVAHPQFDAATLDNDIAVLQTANVMAYGTNVRSVCLPAAGSEPATGELATLTGWGATDDSGAMAAKLMAVDVPIVDRAKLGAQYGAGEITDNMIGAGVDEGGKGGAKGDEGGPLVVRSAKGVATLVGLYSWSKGAALPGHASVFTRVDPYVDGFLKENVVGDEGETGNAPCGQGG